MVSLGVHRCTQMHYRRQIWTPICTPGYASMHTGLPCGATWASQCAPRCAPMHTSALPLVDLDTHMSTWVCFRAHQAAVWSLMSLPGCPSVFTDAIMNHQETIRIPLGNHQEINRKPLGNHKGTTSIPPRNNLGNHPGKH